MTDIDLGDPRVAAYISDLDAELTSLPAKQAAELREQILAHLEDALSTSSNELEVGRVLDRLGSPVDLVAEAAQLGPGSTSGEGRRVALRARLRRVRTRSWVLAGIAVVLVLSGRVYTIAAQTASQLADGGAYTWGFPIDSARAVQTEAAGATQWTAPIRPGQEQGFVFSVYNPSPWTQTVLGVPAGSLVGFGSNPTIRVSVPNLNVERGGFTPARTSSSQLAARSRLTKFACCWWNGDRRLAWAPVSAWG